MFDNHQQRKASAFDFGFVAVQFLYKGIRILVNIFGNIPGSLSSHFTKTGGGQFGSDFTLSLATLRDSL